MVTLRFLLSFAVQRDMKLKQLDVKTAYLNAEIDEEIFVQQPLGFEVLKDSENLVCKLQKIVVRTKTIGTKLVLYPKRFFDKHWIQGEQM